MSRSPQTATSKLALLGGAPVLSESLPPYNMIGEAERHAVNKVLDTGILSGFIGAPGPDFDGGPAVQELEALWSEHFNCRHAISVNSATSGLYAAVGAAGVGPGDEVIVPPYTMSATAMAPLVYGGIPVFVDIEPNHFCLDPTLVKAAITPRTRAIIAVNLFGHPAELHALRALADEHGLYLIEDNAQAPLAKENGRYAGTIGHIGVFSLNRHKHIQTGEGGMCMTVDSTLADRLRAIRNHGENMIDALGLEGVPNMIGFNYRLSELSAAVGIAQLENAEAIVRSRVNLAEKLTNGLNGLDGITPPSVRTNCQHVYYVWPARYDTEIVGVSRDTFSRALAAEGFDNAQAYVPPLYRLPIFRERRAFGNDGWPFTLSKQEYPDGMCPVTEQMHNTEMLMFLICAYDPTDDQAEQLVAAFHKVYEGRDALRAYERDHATVPATGD